MSPKPPTRDAKGRFFNPNKPAPWPRGGVYKPEPGKWFVPSKSRPGMLHTVVWHYEDGPSWFTCSCEAAQKYIGRRMDATYRCRHVLLVAEAEKADGLPKRHTPPPNISALVD